MRFLTIPLAILAMTLTIQPTLAADPAGVFRMKLGDFTVVALKDVQNSRPLDKLIVNPAEIPNSGVKNPDDPAALPVNAFVVDTGASLILFDSGNGKAANGQALDNLRAAGYQPEQVTAVMLTHLHGDHVGGMAVDGKPVFPNATVYLERREANFWLGPEALQTAPESRRGGMEKARVNLEPYEKAGKLTIFDGARTLLPGIDSVPAYGHTPGHTAYMLDSKGQRLLVWGDIMHVQQLQLPNPNVSVVFDVDALMARETRKTFLAHAVAQGYPVAGVHMTFPGIGRIKAEGKGYRWEPVTD